MDLFLISAFFYSFSSEFAISSFYIFITKTVIMQKCFAVTLFFLLPIISIAQKLDKLTVEKIMRDPKWIGTSPSNIYWSDDAKTLYFNWNPDVAPADSLYFITLSDHHPVKASTGQKLNSIAGNTTVWNANRTAYVYTKNGDIFFKDAKTGVIKRIVQTIEKETDPVFSFNDKKIVYTSKLNLYAWDIATCE